MACTLQTFWLTVIEDRASSQAGSIGRSISTGSSSGCDEYASQEKDCVDLQAEKSGRLVRWHVDVLSRLLCEIVAHRKINKQLTHQNTNQSESIGSKQDKSIRSNNVSVIDEVKEIIELPKFITKAPSNSTESVVLEPEIHQQLHSYVEQVASLYHNNDFHNFEVSIMNQLLLFFLQNEFSHSLSACKSCDYVSCQNAFKNYQRGCLWDHIRPTYAVCLCVFCFNP